MIYVASPKGILVFTEPASPHFSLQVPGGTIEQKEDGWSSTMWRYYYRADVEEDDPDSGEHYEMHPSGGHEPILHRLF